ncbi:MAG TPA: pyridoxamine 5'-phosphate oxidase family protein [Thermodesulfovibrionales bacterium]|nr:pyridoxamine 5'-phosphate oxidase family protein [Thermodesulfovibrionales bacterium]
MSDLKQRIFDLAKDFQLMNFATITEEGRPWVRYVVGKADNELVFRFCTHLETRKVGQIRKDPHVHISLGAENLETARHWLQVEGKAEVSTEKNERHSFWFDELKNYFTGPDDPNYCVIIVRPSRIAFGTMGVMAPEVWEPRG